MLAPNTQLNLERFLQSLNLALSIRINCRKWKTAVIELNENSGVLISEGVFPCFTVMLHKNTWESWGKENWHKIKFTEFQCLKVMAQLSGGFSCTWLITEASSILLQLPTFVSWKKALSCCLQKISNAEGKSSIFKLLDISLWWGIGGWKDSAVTKSETISFISFSNCRILGINMSVNTIEKVPISQGFLPSHPVMLQKNTQESWGSENRNQILKLAGYWGLVCEHWWLKVLSNWIL